MGNNVSHLGQPGREPWTALPRDRRGPSRETREAAHQKRLRHGFARDLRVADRVRPPMPPGYDTPDE